MNATAFVKNLNGMMQASRGMPEAAKSDKFTKIRVSDDEKFIVIPADLWKFDKNLTLKIAPGTQISYDNDNNILIPRGETMRMVGQADQNKAIYVLNI